MLTFSEYFIQEKNKVKHNFQVHLNYFSMLISTFHPQIVLLKSTSTPNPSTREEIWPGVVPKAAVTTCILFIHHMRCIISLVIACVLVVLQVVTVGSELGDK